MKIAVIGANGNMGKRYRVILRYLGAEVVPIDIGTSQEDLGNCDGFLIATPTDTHIKLIDYYALYGKPILCEKPLSFDVEAIKDVCRSRKLKLRMINQYQYFEERRKAKLKDIKVLRIDDGAPKTSYNYYKSGGDGLLWDCINIIGLAEGTVDLSNESPIWECTLNGVPLDLSDMDLAYIWNLRDWMEKLDHNKSYIIQAHERVREFIDAYNNDRDTD